MFLMSCKVKISRPKPLYFVGSVFHFPENVCVDSCMLCVDSAELLLFCEKERDCQL